MSTRILVLYIEEFKMKAKIYTALTTASDEFGFNASTARKSIKRNGKHDFDTDIGFGYVMKAPYIKNTRK